MKNNENNTTNIIIATAETLAKISACATLKLLVLKWEDEKLVELRNGLQKDFTTLKRQATATEQITAHEKAIEENNEKINLYNAIIKECNRTIKNALQIPLEILNQAIEERERATAKIEQLQAENKQHRDRLLDLYPVLDIALTDGIDLYQIAFGSIWEDLTTNGNIQTAINNTIAQYQDLLYLTDEQKTALITNILSNIKDITTLSVPYKTKDGSKDYTAKTKSDKAIRDYLNGYRSGTAYKTDYIIVGYDKNGNELTIQNNALQTAGGVDSVEEKMAFNSIITALNLTDSEKRLLKMLLQGKTEKQIATAFQVSQQAIHKRIVKLREKAAKISFTPKEYKTAK